MVNVKCVNWRLALLLLMEFLTHRFKSFLWVRNDFVSRANFWGQQQGHLTNHFWFDVQTTNLFCAFCWREILMNNKQYDVIKISIAAVQHPKSLNYLNGQENVYSAMGHEHDRLHDDVFTIALNHLSSLKDMARSTRN